MDDKMQTEAKPPYSTKHASFVRAATNSVVRLPYNVTVSQATAYHKSLGFCAGLRMGRVYLGVGLGSRVWFRVLFVESGFGLI